MVFRLSLVAVSGGLLFVGMSGLLIVVASFVEHRRWVHELHSWGSQAPGSSGFSSCSTGSHLLWLLRPRAHELGSRGAWALIASSTWRLPKPVVEPMSPELAGNFLSIVPSEKSQQSLTLWNVSSCLTSWHRIDEGLSCWFLDYARQFIFTKYDVGDALWVPVQNENVRPSGMVNSVSASLMPAALTCAWVCSVPGWKLPLPVPQVAHQMCDGAPSQVQDDSVLSCYGVNIALWSSPCWGQRMNAECRCLPAVLLGFHSSGVHSGLGMGSVMRDQGTRAETADSWEERRWGNVGG